MATQSQILKWANRKRRADTGGEGSRGGNVIGHTKSGKPIYAPRDGHADALAADMPHRGHAFAAEHSDGYSRADHFNAHAALMAMAKAARAEGRTAHAYHLGAVAAGHKHLARGEDAYGARIPKGQN